MLDECYKRGKALGIVKISCKANFMDKPTFERQINIEHYTAF